MQAERQPAYPLLYSLRGFQGCDLLFTEAERAAWQRVLECRASALECGGSAPLWIAAEASPRPAEVPAAGAAPIQSAGDRTHSKALRAVSERAAQTLLIAERNNRLLDIVLDQLPRRAGVQDYFVRALLTRAWQRSLTGSAGAPQTGPSTISRAAHESAQSDLEGAWEIAARGPMPLFLADILIYRVRLFGWRIAD